MGKNTRSMGTIFRLAYPSIDLYNSEGSMSPQSASMFCILRMSCLVIECLRFAMFDCVVSNDDVYLAGEPIYIPTDIPPVQLSIVLKAISDYLTDALLN